MNIHPNHKDLLKHATTQEKRIERDTVDPQKAFKPRHESKKQSTLNLRELL